MSDPAVDQLTEGLDGLSVKPKVEVEEVAAPAKVKAEDDDGYNSANSEEVVSTASKKSEEDEEEEKELEPLSFIDEKSGLEIVHLTYDSRGPIPIDHDTMARYNPYSRPGAQVRSTVEPNLIAAAEYDTETSLPKPNVMILRKYDTANPSKLDVPVTWSNKYEICIERYRLPEETYFGKETGLENKVQLFIQLNPSVRELKSFLADVKTEDAQDGINKNRFIGPIVISLKTELAGSQEARLLEMTNMEERTAAFNLVNKKEISQLTSGIGPHKDTVLSVLCAQRNPANPGNTFAQIHAVIQRLVTHVEPKVQQTVFKQNNNQISAFEIAAITNNSVVACYLAEVMYNLSPDTRSAIRSLNCKDTQGNTIIHLLARKGDSNQQTLRDLLNMKLTDGTKIFTIVSNSKKQFPMHIAVQHQKNQPETIKTLYQAMNRSFEVVDDDGMTALHYACQRTSDVSLVRTILSYKKDNINQCSRDGLTALDLVLARTGVTASTKGMFAIETRDQDEIVTLMRNNGAKTGLELSNIHQVVIVKNLNVNLTYFSWPRPQMSRTTLPQRASPPWAPPTASRRAPGQTPWTAPSATAASVTTSSLSRQTLSTWAVPSTIRWEES